MKGFYLNCKKDKALNMINRIDCHFRIDNIPSQIGLSGFVINDPFEWKQSPFYLNDKDDIYAACYGWFIYKNNKNNLRSFSTDFTEQGEKVLKDISGGMFVIVIKNNSGAHIINDPFGFSCHYYRKTSNELEIAPSPYFLSGEKHISDIANSIFNKYKQLFGDMTLFDDIKRLNPATIYKASFKTYYKPKIRSFIPENVTEQIKEFVDFWDYDNRVAALSGGLDSRLIVACSNIKFGYTFGPEKIGDRKSAGIFKNEFQNYYGFSVLNFNYYTKDIQLVKDIFTGLCPSPSSALFPIYRHVRNYFGKDAYVTFDGFLGDVLQRGTLLNINTGYKGYFLKAFPSFTLKMSAEKILAGRYSLLNSQELDLLIKDFREKTSSLDTDDYHKILYYEFAFSRGARVASNGGVVMNSQFFTVAPPFTYVPLFENIFSADILETLSFKTLQRIWKTVDKKYSSVPTQSVYAPNSAPTQMRFQRLYSRFSSRLLKKRNPNYTDEIKSIKWLD